MWALILLRHTKWYCSSNVLNEISVSVIMFEVGWSLWSLYSDVWKEVESCSISGKVPCLFLFYDCKRVNMNASHCMQTVPGLVTPALCYTVIVLMLYPLIKMHNAVSERRVILLLFVYLLVMFRACLKDSFFTHGQYWPPGIVVACVHPSVCLSVTKFVRAITHHPFKLGSPNLDHRCKRPWLRSLLFWGVIDLDLQD